jgi:secondary thiamine-phosphate synthase enzyme
MFGCGQFTLEAGSIMYRQQVTIETRGRGTHEITRQLQQIVERSGVDQGLCHLFVHHTSASLIVCENADPTVRRDLEHFAAGLVPDGDPSYRHDSEGPDDMPAHIRSILTLTSLTIPVQGHQCDLGTWQGVFLWEHRTSPHRRRITVTVTGTLQADR